MAEVFVSYSHDDEGHKKRVLALANRLRDDGFDCLIDQYEDPGPAEGWREFSLRGVIAAKFVLVVCSKD